MIPCRPGQRKRSSSRQTGVHDGWLDWHRPCTRSTAQRTATDDVLLRSSPTHELVVRCIGASPHCHQKRETGSRIRALILKIHLASWLHSAHTLANKGRSQGD